MRKKGIGELGKGKKWVGGVRRKGKEGEGKKWKGGVRGEEEGKKGKVCEGERRKERRGRMCEGGEEGKGVVREDEARSTHTLQINFLGSFLYSDTRSQKRLLTFRYRLSL